MSDYDRNIASATARYNAQGSEYDRERSGLTYDEWVAQEDAEQIAAHERQQEAQEARERDTLWQIYRQALDRALCGEQDWLAGRIEMPQLVEWKAAARAALDAYCVAAAR